MTGRSEAEAAAGTRTATLRRGDAAGASLQQRPRRAVALFVAWALTLAVGWLVLLPRMCQYTPVQGHLRWLDERRINPNALYYTELEVLDPLWEGAPPSAQACRVDAVSIHSTTLSKSANPRQLPAPLPRP